MAVVDSPEAQEFIETLKSLGVTFDDPENITDEELRAKSLTFINDMGEIFIEGYEPTTDPFENDVLSKIQEGIDTNLGTPNSDGVTPLNQFALLGRGDVDGFMETINFPKIETPFGTIDPKGDVRDRLNQIFDSNSDDLNEAVKQAMEYLGTKKPEVKALYDTLKQNAPELLDNLPAAIGVLENSESVFASLEALDNEKLFDGATADDIETDPAPPADTEPKEITAIQVTGATENVQTFLFLLVPVLNEQLENNDQLDQIPEFMRGFFDLGVLENTVLGIDSVTGVMDVQTQASLQNVLAVLSHPQVMGLNGKPWEYTKEKGQEILEKFPAFLEKYPQLAEGDPPLTLDTVKGLIDALDLLYDARQLVNYNLFENEIRVPDLLTDLFQDRIDEAGDNKALVGALGSLTKIYSGWEMPQLMMGLQADIPDNPHPEDAFAALAHFYKTARENHKGTPEEFTDYMILMLATTRTLPFGDTDRAQIFYREMADAARDVQDMDPAEAAQAFANRARETMEDLGGPGAFKSGYRRALQDPILAPGLEDFTVTSDGQTFNIQDVARLYDDFHLTSNEVYRRSVETVGAYAHRFITFTDDAGDVYIAVIDRETMMFMVEKIDVDALQEAQAQMIADNASGADVNYEARYSAMMEQDPGFAMLTRFYYGHPGKALSYVKDIDERGRNPFSEFSSVRRVAAEQSSRQIKTSYNSAATPTPPEEVVSRPAAVADTRSFDVRLANTRAIEAFANDAYFQPQVLNAHTLDLLTRNAPYSLQVGATYGSEMRISRIFDESNGDGAKAAFYDAEEKSLRIVDLPDRAVLESLYRAVHSDIEFTVDDNLRAEIQKYEGFADMVQAYENRPAGQALNIKVRNLLLSVDPSLKNVDLNPSENQSTFSEAVSGVKPADSSDNVPELVVKSINPESP